MPVIQFILASLALPLLLWAGVAAPGAWLWRQECDRIRRHLPADSPSRHRFDPAMLDGLPAPVARYLAAVIRPGQPLILRADFAHEGRFDMGRATPAWKSFTSGQTVTAARPAFLWDGRIALFPGLPVRVIDAFVAREGILIARLLGLVPLAGLRGGGALAEGELLRWLAEAPWYPTALLPGQGVTWTAIDDHSAMASVTDGTVTADLLYRFGADGLPASVHADARARSLGDRLIPTPWEGRFWAYASRDGLLIPTEGEVAWLLPEGRAPYWRGTLTAVRYTVAP